MTTAKSTPDQASRRSGISRRAVIGGAGVAVVGAQLAAGATRAGAARRVPQVEDVVGQALTGQNAFR